MINTVNNILPIELAVAVYNYCNRLQWSYNWTSNKKLSPYYHWNSSLSSGLLHNTLDITQTVDKPIIDAWHYIQANYLSGHKLIRCYANSYTYGTEGYPHTDSLRNQDVTTILYITKNWLREWGGETIIYDGNNIIQAILPDFNSGIIFSSNIPHCARGVSRICSELRTVLVFKSTPIDSDQTRDRLQIFLQDLDADKLPHGDSSLLAHLLGTYDILKTANQPEYLCLAGGLHSIFGTKIYEIKCLDQNYLDLVTNFAGTNTVELIKLFSTLDRPHILEQYLTQGVEIKHYNDLCLIEVANLMEQNSLNAKYYPKLKELWNTLFKPYLKQ